MEKGNLCGSRLLNLFEWQVWFSPVGEGQECGLMSLPGLLIKLLEKSTCSGRTWESGVLFCYLGLSHIIWMNRDLEDHTKEPWLMCPPEFLHSQAASFWMLLRKYDLTEQDLSPVAQRILVSTFLRFKASNKGSFDYQMCIPWRFCWSLRW